MAKKRGPKRNKHQKSRDYKREAKLRAEGKTFREIAKEVGLDAKQVRLDLAFIDEQLIDAAKADLEKAKAESVAKFRYAQIQAHQAWLLSLEEEVRVTVRHSTQSGGDDGARNSNEQTKMVAGQSGNPGHMRNYLKAVKDEAELLGLYQLGSGKGDEAAERLNDLHDLLELMRQEDQQKRDLENSSPPKP